MSQTFFPSVNTARDTLLNTVKTLVSTAKNNLNKIPDLMHPQSDAGRKIQEKMLQVSQAQDLPISEHELHIEQDRLFKNLTNEIKDSSSKLLTRLSLHVRNWANKLWGLPQTVEKAKASSLYQVAPLNELLAGGIKGKINLAHIAKRCNFAIGVHDMLKGELVAHDGNFYIIDEKGNATRIDEDDYKNIEVPFSCGVLFDSSNESLKPKKNFSSLEDLQEFLKEKIEVEKNETNFPHAIEVKAKFKNLQLASTKKQSKLTHAKDAGRVVLEPIPEIEGTLVGFRTPKFLDAVNDTGKLQYHFHFIDREGKIGGHLGGFGLMEDAQIKINKLDTVKLKLPDTEAFRDRDTSVDPRAEIAQAMKASKK